MFCDEVTENVFIYLKIRKHKPVKTMSKIIIDNCYDVLLGDFVLN